MENLPVDIAQSQAIDQIPESCGAVTVGCSDVAGIVESVLETSKRLRSEHVALQQTVSALESDQRQVDEATEEARLLSQKAMDRLADGTRLISSSLGQINELLSLVDTLSAHVTDFAAAMEQVKRVSQGIETIADTTNILALNAMIEAARAGDAGRGFAVVANEVKELASKTRLATDEISSTIDTLAGQAERVVTRIEDGAKASSAAKESVASIENAMDDVSELVGEVDRQNDQIARATGTISQHVHRVRDVFIKFDEAEAESARKLQRAHGEIENLEMTANGMFDRIVHAGLSPVDSAMVERARQVAAEVALKAETAIANGVLDRAALFDRDYVEIAGSNPRRFRNRLTEWADRNWRPLLDAAKLSDARIMASACTDICGFLPTHLTEFSRAPTGDLTHDTRYCRNGRILFDPIDQKAKQSNAPYMMAVYRQEHDGQSYRVVRNVYVPLFINRQRWGDLELAYVI